MRDPIPFQLPAIRYAESRSRPMLFMDKRTGKCYVSTRWALAHGAKNILIIAPRSACPDWLNELEADGQTGILWEDVKDTATPTSLAHALDPATRSHPGNLTADIPLFFIINPEALFTAKGRTGGKHPSPKDVALLPWDAVIWDEITTIRNPKAQITQVAHACFGDIKLKCGLSGEPAPEGPTNLFELFRWLHGHFMGKRNYWQWLGQFFERDRYDWIPKSGTLKLIKRAVDDLSYRLTKKEVGFQTTWSRPERRYCYLPQKIRRNYDGVEKYLELPNPDGSFKETLYPIVALNWMRRLTGGCMPQNEHTAKLDLLEEMIAKGGPYSREPVVVTFAFNSEIEAAESRLTDLAVSKRFKGCFGVITGDTSVQERKDIQRRFQTGRIRVLLMQVKVAKFGINLSAADVIIRYSHTYSYEDWSQSRDRIIHPLKHSLLHEVHLIARDTIDEDVVEALGQKQVEARYFMSNIVANLRRRAA